MLVFWANLAIGRSGLVCATILSRLCGPSPDPMRHPLRNLCWRMTPAHSDTHVRASDADQAEMIEREDVLTNIASRGL